MKAFLSHSSSDKELATLIYRRLRDQAVSVWFDKMEMRLGDSLLDKIADGISESDYLLVLVTKHSNQSRWVQEEVGIARTREINDGGPKVIPLVLQGAKIPANLAAKLYITIDNSGAGIDEIMPAIFRDAFILDIKLSSKNLELDKDELADGLYEFTRNQRQQLIFRIDNGNFSQQVLDTVTKTLAEPNLDSSLADQIRRESNLYQTELPLFWNNCASLLGEVCSVIFSEYGEDLQAVRIAQQTVLNCFGYAEQILRQKMQAAVFPYYAEKFNYIGLASFLENLERNRVENDEDALYRICEVPKHYTSVRCDLVGNVDENVIDQKITVPVGNDSDEAQLRMRLPPQATIQKYIWYTWCVPQIFERALGRMSFGDGKPIHELPYKIGLRMTDYLTIGWS